MLNADSILTATLMQWENAMHEAEPVRLHNSPRQSEHTDKHESSLCKSVDLDMGTGRLSIFYIYSFVDRGFLLPSGSDYCCWSTSTDLVCWAADDLRNGALGNWGINRFVCPPMQWNTTDLFSFLFMFVCVIVTSDVGATLEKPSPSNPRSLTYIEISFHFSRVYHHLILNPCPTSSHGLDWASFSPHLSASKLFLHRALGLFFLHPCVVLPYF